MKPHFCARISFVFALSATLFACGSSPSAAPLGSASSDLRVGQAVRLAFTAQPTGAAVGARMSTVIVAVEDAFGNLVSGGTYQVKLAIAGGVAISGTTSVATSAGRASFTNLSIAAAGSYVITATSMGLVGVTSARFTITAGVASQLAFTVQPTHTLSGSIISPAVRVDVKDALGNDVSSNLAITLALGNNPSGATLSGVTTLTASGGRASFGSLSVNRPGTGYTLVATGGGLSKTSAAFDVTAGPARQLVIDGGNGQSGAAGGVLPVALSVQARDSAGNGVSGVAVTWSVVSGGGGVLPLQAQTDATGHATATATLGTVAGSNQFKASVTGLPAAIFTEQGQALTGQTLRLAVSSAPVAGQAFAATATVVDAFGNVVLSSLARITLAVNAPFVLSGTRTVTAADGVATFSGLSLCGAGSGVILTASATGITSGTAATSVALGAPARYLEQGNGQSATVGTALPLLLGVIVQDTCGDALPGLTVSWAGGQLRPATSTTDATGLATSSLLLGDIAGAAVYTASLNGAVVASFTETATPDVPSHLAFVQAPRDTAATAAFSPAVTVVLLDKFNNRTTAAAPTAVTMAVTGAPDLTLLGQNPATTVQGLATFTNLQLTTSGSFTLTASAPSLVAATSGSFTVSPGAVTALLIDPNVPASAAAGSAVSLDVVAVDAFQNPVPSTSVLWTAPASGLVDGAATSPTTCDSAGVSSTAATVCTVAGTCIFTASAGAVSASYSIAATAGPASALVFAPVAAVVPNLTPLDPVAVTLVDDFGNLEADNSTAVTLSLASTTLPGDQTSGLTGTLTAVAANGTATFSGLAIVSVDIPYYFIATAAGLSGASNVFSASCASGSACGTACFNLQSDPANCGACNNACPAPPNTVASCITGQCGLACAAGFDQCTGNQADGCQPLDTAQNCGSCGNSCTAAQACTAGACVNLCTPSTPDGTNCGGGNVCRAGTCVGTRTVSGQLTTIYQVDDGSTTTVNGWPFEMGGATVTALLVPDNSSAGYAIHPVALAADSSFSVSDIPAGSYFLQIDTPALDPTTGVVPVINRNFYEATTSAPDLAVIKVGRTDVAQTTQPTPVTFDLSGLTPWVNGAYPDQIRVSSTGAGTINFIRTSYYQVKPTAGVTSIDATLNWSRTDATGSVPPGVALLPDASQGDVTWVYQRAITNLGSGPTAGLFYNYYTYAKLTDVTLVDGAGGTIDAAMSPVPQTGTLPGDLRFSQFAALASGMNPAAAPSSPAVLPPGIGVIAWAYSTNYGQVAVNGPLGRGGSVDSSPTGTATEDVNYGPVAYGQFFDSLWHETAQFVYSYDVPLTAPGSSGLVTTINDNYFFSIPPEQLPATIVPVLGPPTAPLLNGANAFLPAAGVGLQPVISWSPPLLGVGTHYTAYASAAAGTQFQSGDIASCSATIYDATSFLLPPGCLKNGNFYLGSVNVTNLAGDVLDGPIVRSGFPVIGMSTDFGLFQPDLPATRTVSSTVQTIFTEDNGSTTTVTGWPTELFGASVTALVVRDTSSATGYTSFLVTPAADGSFAVTGIPVGPYFIQIDTPTTSILTADGSTVPAVQRNWYETTVDVPDLTVHAHSRANRTAATQSTLVNLIASPLDPLTVKLSLFAELILYSPQAGVNNARPASSMQGTRPQPGDTSINATFDWLTMTSNSAQSYLPDASQGDFTYFFQRLGAPLPGDPLQGTQWSTVTFAGVPFTLHDGVSGVLTANMTPAPSGSIVVDLPFSQFANLAASVNPSATPSQDGASIGIHTEPDGDIAREAAAGSPIGYIFWPAAPTTDVSDGAIAYGRIPSPAVDSEFFNYPFDLTLPAPNGAPAFAVTDAYAASGAVGTLADPLVPVAGAATAVTLNGVNAYAALTAVGAQPTIVWQPPQSGSATRYGLNVSAATGVVQPGEIVSFSANLFTGTRLTLPPGFLQSGRTYSGNITSVVSSDTATSPVLRTSVPFHSIGTDFGLFQPD